MLRKLAAILAADVVGYSPLMGDDEMGTLKALRACDPIGTGNGQSASVGLIERFL